MSVRHVTVRPGLYRDSVRLMQISQALEALPGVDSALIAMATELNVDLLAGMGFDPPVGAGPNDMLVAVSAADESTVASALERLETELHDPGPTASGTGGTGTGGSATAG